MSAVLKLSEADWQRKVIDAAKLYRWRYVHFRPARTEKGWRTALEGDPGFPDLCLVKPPRVIFVELKTDTGVLHGDQITWLDDLKEAGVESYCWRPSDWETVFRTLAKT